MSGANLGEGSDEDFAEVEAEIAEVEPQEWYDVIDRTRTRPSWALIIPGGVISGLSLTVLVTKVLLDHQFTAPIESAIRYYRGMTSDVGYVLEAVAAPLIWLLRQLHLAVEMQPSWVHLYIILFVFGASIGRIFRTWLQKVVFVAIWAVVVLLISLLPGTIDTAQQFGLSKFFMAFTAPIWIGALFYLPLRFVWACWESWKSWKSWEFLRWRENRFARLASIWGEAGSALWVALQIGATPGICLILGLALSWMRNALGIPFIELWLIVLMLLALAGFLGLLLLIAQLHMKPEGVAARLIGWLFARFGADLEMPYEADFLEPWQYLFLLEVWLSVLASFIFVAGLLLLDGVVRAI